MALRLSEGIDLDRLTALSGLAPNRQAVAALIERGLLERCGDPRLRATPAGRLILNEIVRRLAASLEVSGSVEIDRAGEG
jgi:oxygen-independent coproporphyrinogen-3 oxidase